ncbi:unnamed protein product [Mytilus coruscus]|uniref:Uncharacterized protein n=1 Tax=Mytilus coruscus TaxID=42192 RepID=A0A6J8C135_MYTCO|nr:unnamed protein product [Mytilus coruscus]
MGTLCTNLKTWQLHFEDVSAGRVLPDHKGRYIVGSGSLRTRGQLQENPKMELVTPVAQAIEMANVTELPLHGIFAQIDLLLQQTPIGETGTNDSYKAYLDNLLTTNHKDIVLLESQLFYKDSPDHDDQMPKNGDNMALYLRSLYINKGKVLDLEGPLHLDIFQQERFILNVVGLILKLWPSECFPSDDWTRPTKFQSSDLGR